MNGSRYSDPAWRAVEQDRREQHGQRLVLWPVLAWGPHYSGGYGGGGGVGDGGGDGDGGGGGGGGVGVGDGGSGYGSYDNSGYGNSGYSG